MIALAELSIADAPSYKLTAWPAIDWAAVPRVVRRLQVRIVKAARANEWHKVRSLQRLLTNSFSARAWAVRRVTENQGKKTPGVDGEVWDTPTRKAQAVERLKKHRFVAQPLRRTYIPKANGKLRPLGIPTMQDRAYQSLHLLGLDPVAEVTGDINSYGFRRERSTADAIERGFAVLARKSSAQWILEADIEACFDKLSHAWLLTHIPMHKPSLRQWLKAGYMEEHLLHPTSEGSPQGGPISPVLANMTLDGLEKLLHEHFSARFKVHLVRYADDFIVTATEKATLEERVLPLVQEFLAERGLRLSPTKTTITHIDDGFDFLGQTLRKYNGKLLIKPSKQKQKALLEKVRTIIKTEGRNLTAVGLINRLNPIIRGWANYHRHVVSKNVFRRIDYLIHLSLWQWARHRHSNKSRTWVYRQYIRPPGAEKALFQTQTTDKNGEKRLIRIYTASQTPIRRHIKVRGAANPYDPQWELYFEQRQFHKTCGELRRRPDIFTLLRLQEGRCPVCRQPITLETGWHDHHIRWRVFGGDDKLNNRILLHPTCHQQVHSPGYSGPPLRPLPGV